MIAIKVQKKLTEADKVRSKARTAELDKLYEIATSPTSTRADLKKAWDSTKSSKVRRAIAMHGNADVNIMKMSARLYVKEVLNNPSFELMRLFDEDPFITALKLCYEDPKKAASSRIVYNIAYKDRPNMIRAMLLSPKLDYPTLSAYILQNLNATEFKRELGDKDVYNRVRDLVNTNCINPVKKRIGVARLDSLIRTGHSNSQRVADFFTFYKVGFLSKQEIYNLVYMVGVSPRSSYGSNPIAVNIITDALKDGDVENATKLLLCGSYSTFNGIVKKISESSQSSQVKLKQLDTYVKCFALLVELFACFDRDKAGRFWNMETFHKSIFELIAGACVGSSKKKDLRDLDKEELIAIHKVCTQTGFEKYASYCLPSLVLKDKPSLYALNQCPQETIEFFVKNNMVISTIQCSTSVDKIVKTLEHINDSVGVEGAIFNLMKIDYFKTIVYDKSILRGHTLVNSGLDTRLISLRTLPTAVLMCHGSKLTTDSYSSTNPFVLNMLGKVGIMNPLPEETV